MRHSLKKTVITLCFSIATVSSCFAVDENYYSEDIDDAVKAAKSNPVNEAYVGARWYNRSTSRSFNFPKMMNTEMDTQVIEGAMGPTAAGEAAATQAQQPVVDAALDRKNQSDALVDANSDSRRNEQVNSINKVDIPYEIHIKESRSENKSLGQATIRDVRGRPSQTKGWVRESQYTKK